MKTLLEILGFSSLDEKEKKVLQRLRDEAIEEKANDELNDSAGKGISDTLDALRQKPLAAERPLEKKLSLQYSPTYAMAFTGIVCVFFLSFLWRENQPSPPSDPVAPLASSSQRAEVLEWTESVLDLDPPKLVDTLSLPSEDWMAKPKVDELHAMLPIDSIVSVYDELSQPPLPRFQLPEFTDSGLEIYLEEGRRLKKELQNGFGFIIESIASLEIGAEG